MNVEDLCKKPFNLKPDIEARLQKLAAVMSTLESIYGQKFIVTSGYRTPSEHAAIYSRINEKRHLADLEPIPTPLRSNHLSGNAVDVYDPEMEIKYWIIDNEHVLEELGLYCEDFSYCRNWVHFQNVPPASKKRFFKPR